MAYEILTPVVTIFDKNSNIDYNSNKNVIEYLIENGIDGIVPLGSTGEFASMSLEKKKEFVSFYVTEVDNRVSIMPGTGSMNFEETIEVSNFSISLGVKGVLVIAPYYYALCQNKIFEYYDALAKKVKGDVYIYNFEARTGHNISADTVYNLCKQNKNIKGIKDSTGVVSHTLEISSRILNDFPYFEIYSGFDDHFISNIMSGGKGCIAALSNIVPELWTKWVKAANDKDFDMVADIYKIINPLMKLYSMDSNFSLLFKKLMDARGLEIYTETLFPFDKIDETIFNKSLELVQNVYKIF